MTTATSKKCRICGRPAFDVRSRFCHRCSIFHWRMKRLRLPRKVVKAIWDYVRKHGYVCYYTGMALEMFDTTSPWYCVFDHWVPRDPNKIVLTSALINSLKADLSENEFWRMIQQLAEYFLKGTKIKKMSLLYWQRDYNPQLAALAASFEKRWGGLRPPPLEKICCLCGKPVFNIRSKYCLQCSQFTHRLEIKRFPHEAIQGVLADVHKYGFVCRLTGLPVELSDYRSPWYGVFSCLVPGDKRKIGLVCAVVNEMKSDLSEKEFWYYILQLYHFKFKGGTIRKKKLVYWYRMTPRQMYLKSVRDFVSL